MNNFVIGLKKFFTNKNVVTIILLMVILVALYFGYSSSIKQQTDPINMPVAAKKINPQTKITSELVAYKKIPKSMISENTIKDAALIVGRYTNINVTVPQGSLFYNEWLVTADKLPGNWIEQLDHEKGEVGYYMPVSVESTLGNSVLPNTYIDIYMRASDENGTIMFGKLLKNVKVLVVHDGSGKNIFADAENIGSPSRIGFAVSEDLYRLLNKAQYLNVNLVIAPRGSTVPAKDEIIVSSQTLRDYIDAQTISIEDDPEIEETTDDEMVEITPDNQTVVE